MASNYFTLEKVQAAWQRNRINRTDTSPAKLVTELNIGNQHVDNLGRNFPNLPPAAANSREQLAIIRDKLSPLNHAMTPSYRSQMTAEITTAMSHLEGKLFNIYYKMQLTKQLLSLGRGNLRNIVTSGALI